MKWDCEPNVRAISSGWLAMVIPRAVTMRTFSNMPNSPLQRSSRVNVITGSASQNAPLGSGTGGASKRKIGARHLICFFAHKVKPRPGGRGFFIEELGLLLPQHGSALALDDGLASLSVRIKPGAELGLVRLRYEAGRRPEFHQFERHLPTVHLGSAVHSHSPPVPLVPPPLVGTCRGRCRAVSLFRIHKPSPLPSRRLMLSLIHISEPTR